MTTENSSQRPVTAGATVYLMEELGDARLRCDQLVRYTSEASKLIENSTHRDHFFEIAGHLIQAIPETLFKLQKALQAVALAATRMDYEEIKQELRPEKVDQLERVLQDVRIRHVQRRSEPWTPEQAARSLRNMVAAIRESGLLPRTELTGLILDLEFGIRKADTPDVAASLEAIAVSIENAKEPPSQLRLAAMLRRVLDDDLMKIPQEQTMERTAQKTGFSLDSLDAGPESAMALTMLTDMKMALIAATRHATANRWKRALLSLGDVVDGVGTVLAQLGNPEGVAKSTALFREVKQTALKMPRGGPDEMDLTAAAWKSADAKQAADAPDPGEAPPFGEAMVSEGLDKALVSLKKAQAAMQSGNSKKMFFGLLGVLDGLGMVGRAYDLPDVGYLMRVWKAFAKMSGARPTTNFSASDEEKESRFEEGKPADPTENMSPEDAKRWKEEHAKNKDKFKAAAVKTKADFDKLQHEMRAHLDTFDLSWSRYEKDPEKNKGKLDDALRYMTALRDVADVLIRNMKGLKEGKTASDDDKQSRFEEGKPADPTENMSPEDAKRWKEEHAKNKDKFKAGSDDDKQSRFEEGKPADPTENMSPADAKKWKEEHDKNKDKFKSAAWKADNTR